MAEEYDNTNRGAAFAPFDTQKLILQGKINVNGNDKKINLVKDQTRGGKTIVEVYEKIGVLFENDKKGNDAAPDYTGPLGEMSRLAAWRKMSGDKPYMTFSVSDQYEDPYPKQGNQDIKDDKIPF